MPVRCTRRRHGVRKASDRSLLDPVRVRPGQISVGSTDDRPDAEASGHASDDVADADASLQRDKAFMTAGIYDASRIRIAVEVLVQGDWIS